MKGIIALDIDGTVTDQAHEIDSRVVDSLNKYFSDGWEIIFITGRPFQWGESTLRILPFSYSIAVQNGALLVEMPKREVIIRRYLNRDVLLEMKKIAHVFETDFVIYSGMENDDLCYYCPSLFPEKTLNYGLMRADFLGEKWRSLSSFSDLPVSQFSSMKFFIDEKRAFLLSRTIEEELGLHAPPNRDPFNSDYFVIQATHSGATKGDILKEYIQKKNIQGPVIAAGDDHNDYSMLQVANMKIVMANAPKHLLDIADIIAPPATQQGLVQGLKEAIRWINKN